MSVTREELGNLLTEFGERLDVKLSARLDNKLGEQTKALDERLEHLDREASRLREEMSSMKRIVEAVRTQPSPYGRPKEFVAVTEFQSVSAPVFQTEGYQG